MTMTPRRCDHALVWDVALPDIFSSSHVSLAAIGAGDVVNEADYHKGLKYSQLEPSYISYSSGHREI